MYNLTDITDKEMFDVDNLVGEDMFVVGQNKNVVEEVVDAAQVSTVVTTVTITTKEITSAQVLEALKTSKPNVKMIVFKSHIDADHQLAEILQAQEQEKLSDAEKDILFQQILEKRRKHFAAKRAKEKRNKPPTKAQQRKIIAFKRINTFEDFRPELVEKKEKRAREELEQEISKKQKVEDDKEKAELKQLMETIPNEKEVAIDVIPLAVKSSRIVDWKIYKEGKKSNYQIVRANGKSQMYMIFSQMLKSFNREDFKDLYKLVKARYGSTRPVENMDYRLWSVGNL
uniref:Uncharacterized protein n=1 Tax=Tanacetum cinerariifolium TaxID=118510 RepID=A0A6L2NPW9_TANCI|nr:hypothetical protein [Tanacetum cinerariifolium]